MNITFVRKQSEVESLGLMYLASKAKEKGHDCKLLNDDGFLTREDILRTNPDMVGFQIFTGYHKRMFQLADEVRSSIRVEIGGPHATYFYEDCIRHADKVYKGEAINTFLSNDSFTSLGNPEVWPLPYRGWTSGKVQNIMTSFGCVKRCSYCYNSTWQEMYDHYKVRQRSVDSVLREAETCTADLIFFQDDFFGWNIKWLREFAEKWNRPYHCQLRIDAVTEERLDLLLKSNCTGVTYAIESANEKIRRELLHRPVSDELLCKKANLIRQSKLKVRTEQMLGIPTSTLEDELKLLELNCFLKPEIAWTSIFQPYRGTWLGEWCVQNGWYEGNNDDIDDTFFKTTRLNFTKERKEEIERLQKVFNLCSKLENGMEIGKSFVKDGKFETLLEKTREISYDQLYRSKDIWSSCWDRGLKLDLLQT